MQISVDSSLVAIIFLTTMLEDKRQRAAQTRLQQLTVSFALSLRWDALLGYRRISASGPSI